MHRILLALAALLSMVSANVLPTQAQGNPPEPPTSPQQLDAPGAQPAVPAGAVFIAADQTRKDVFVRDQALVLNGKVENDVVAINSTVTLGPGAEVGGVVDIIGGAVINDSKNNIRIVSQDRGLVPLISTSFQQRTRMRVQQAVRASSGGGGWTSGQFGLLVLGLLCGLVLMIGAPRATDHVAETVEMRPARCLTTGVGVFFVLLAIMAVDHVLVKSRLIGLLWSPIHVVLTLIVGTGLVFGWLASMRYAGDIIARRMGKPAGTGHLYSRMALGLVTFFVANVILGSISQTLGIAGVGLEFAITLMGVGALVIGGPGRENGWLARR